MNAPAIRASALTKHYIIHRRQATTLKEMVVRGLYTTTESEPYVALRDLSFEVAKGTCLAVVGGNGSGKSTLLKLIAGLTEPTSGSLTVNGRIAALLELGAGFQEDFTGMENIFLQCGILGLTRQQILDRLEDILSFAEIGDFIHTPVRHYSSGMFIRLAFAVAVHVDADILLLDEVFAVGDQSFQIRCQEKIQSLLQNGKTILFVSHSIDHVRTIADQVLWLRHGDLVELGPAADVLPHYFERLLEEGSTRSESTGGEKFDAGEVLHGTFHRTEARLMRAGFSREDGTAARSFRVNEPILARLAIEVREPIPELYVAIAFGYGSTPVMRCDSGPIIHDVEPGIYTVDCRMENTFLTPGIYFSAFVLGDGPEFRKTYSMISRTHAISIINEGAPSQASAKAPMLRGLGSWS